MGIEAAHNNHIIHRDIKPQNIIISKDGKMCIRDRSGTVQIPTPAATHNAASVALPDTIVIGPAPVSYTHLDGKISTETGREQ